MQSVYYIVLVPMVYAALAVFILGTLWHGLRLIVGLKHALRVVVGPAKNPNMLRAVCDAFLSPATLKNHPVRWVFMVSFHIVLFLTILGHLELVGEVGVMQVVRHDVFLGGGVLGILLFAGLLFFLFRRFHAPLAAMSEPGDYYLLILLLLIVLFGSQLHLAQRFFDYSTIGVAEYREYLSGILTFRPALPEVFTEDFVGHSFLLVLHVFCANLFLMLFPWSKLMHAILALPLARLRRR